MFLLDNKPEDIIIALHEKDLELPKSSSGEKGYDVTDRERRPDSKIASKSAVHCVESYALRCPVKRRIHSITSILREPLEQRVR